MLKKSEKIWYRRIFLIPIILAPVLVFFLFLNQKDYYHSFLILSLLLSLFIGLFSRKSETKKISYNFILGLLLSTSQIIITQDQKIFVVDFLLFLWAWLAIHRTGLNMDPRDFNEENLYSGLIDILGSIGALTWLWLGLF